MALGEKLRQARQEAGLSQRQLCGEYMTRNMLSQIENGSARPSMATLQYLAEKLGKTVGYFLEETVQVSENQPLMEQAEQAAKEKDWAQVRRILEGYREPDPLFDGRRALLELMAALELSKEAAKQQRQLYAQQLLQDCLRWERALPFALPGLQRELLLLRSQLEPEKGASLAGLLPRDDRELLLRAEAALEAGDAAGCVCILNAAWDKESFSCLLLRGKAAMALKDYAAAMVCYRAIETVAPQIAWPALEQCCLAMEDYKQAYFYACKQR